MDITKFLEEIKALEQKLRKKVGKNSERDSFLVLVNKLTEKGFLTAQLAKDLGKLFSFRNKAQSQVAPEKLPREVQNLLLKINTGLNF